MIIEPYTLKDKFSDYSNISAKIKNEIKAKRLFRLKRGLYSDNPNERKELVANALYRPSYLSFQYALSYYDLVPEYAFSCTSATALKNRSKRYRNYFGSFAYFSVPDDVYPYGVILSEAGFLIATKEKALCDYLYISKPLSSQKEMEMFLFESMRIDEDDFLTMDFKTLLELGPRYKCKNCDLLCRLIRRRYAKCNS